MELLDGHKNNEIRESGKAMVQYEMYFTNEYIEEILDDLVVIMELHIDKRDINAAMQERDRNSLNNLLLLKSEQGCICIDCNDKDWIFPLIAICQDGVAAKIKEIMLKWENLIRDEYGQKLTEEICNVYGKTQTLLSVIEGYYGITIF